MYHAGVSSGFFFPNRKEAWNVRNPLVIYKKHYEILQLEDDLLTTNNEKMISTSVEW